MLSHTQSNEKMDWETNSHFVDDISYEFEDKQGDLIRNEFPSIFPEDITSHPPSSVSATQLNSISSEKSEQPIINHQYTGSIVFKPSESGLANNLLGLASAFVISVLTNKRLYYGGNYKMDTIFNMKDYWNSPVVAEKGLGATKTSIIDYNRCFSSNSKLAISLSNNPISSIVKSKNLIISTNCPLFHFILMNKDNRQQLEEFQLLPPNVSESYLSFFLYSTILRKYIEPLDVIQQEVASRFENSTGKYIIGMHIRCGVPLADFKDQSSFLTLKDISTFNKCMRSEIQKENSMIVVASDSTKAKTIIRNYNPLREVWFRDGKVQHTMTRHFREMSFSSLQSSFSDMLMLSKANVLVGTARSTFSLTAGAFKGEVPYLVSRGARQCAIPKSVIYLAVCNKFYLLSKTWTESL